MNFDFQKGGIYDPTNAVLMERMRAAGRSILDGLQYLGNSIYQGTNVRQPRQLFQNLHESFAGQLVSLDIFSKFWNSITTAWQAWGDFCSGLIGVYFALYLFLTILEWILRCYGIAFSWRTAWRKLMTQLRRKRRPASSFPHVNPTPLESDPENSPPISRVYGYRESNRDTPIIRETTRADLHAPPPTRSRPLSTLPEEHDPSAELNVDLPSVNSPLLPPNSEVKKTVLLPMSRLSAIQQQSTPSDPPVEPDSSGRVSPSLRGSTRFWDKEITYTPQDPAKLQPEFLKLRTLDLIPEAERKVAQATTDSVKRHFLGIQKSLHEIHQSLLAADQHPVNHARLAQKLIQIETYLNLPTTFTPRSRPKLQRQFGVHPDEHVPSPPTPADLLHQASRLRPMGAHGHPPVGDGLPVSSASFPEEDTKTPPSDSSSSEKVDQ